MRKITHNSVTAFYCWQNRKFDNTRVFTTTLSGGGSSTVMTLHWNTIARTYWVHWKRIIELKDGGHQSRTTKERLNWLLNYKWLGRIYQKNFIWFYENERGEIKLFNKGIARVF